MNRCKTEHKPGKTPKRKHENLQFFPKGKAREIYTLVVLQSNSAQRCRSVDFVRKRAKLRAKIANLARFAQFLMREYGKILLKSRVVRLKRHFLPLSTIR